MPCSGEDFAKLFSGIEIAWAVTPADLNNNWESNINVFWFGKGSDYKIYRDKEDQTNVLWHFTHYAFANPGPAAISEPFIVVDESSGTFILHFIMPSMSPDEAVQFIKNHKEPYHILIAGKPKYLKEFKGAASVVIESDRWVVRDYFEVRFIKVKP
jgi:hypothetical protein